MKNKQYNVKALNDTYKNAHIAMQSIHDVLPSVKNKNMKAELNREYKGYENMINKISDYMDKEHLTPEDIGVIKKAFMWGSIKMKTAFDNSKNQIADMMIKGTVMGIIELTAMKNENKNLDENVSKLVCELLTLEEGYEQDLKKYL